MNISPWEIYWVLQLDSIGALFFVGAIVSAFAAAGILFAGALATDRGCYPSAEQDKSWAQLKRLALRALVLTCVLAPCAALTPSTKTAAAMIVLPAVANNKAIQHEAGDLYKLAKDALKNAVTPAKEPH